MLYSRGRSAVSAAPPLRCYELQLFYCGALLRTGLQQLHTASRAVESAGSGGAAAEGSQAQAPDAAPLCGEDVRQIQVRASP